MGFETRPATTIIDNFAFILLLTSFSRFTYLFLPCIGAASQVKPVCLFTSPAQRGLELLSLWSTISLWHEAPFLLKFNPTLSGAWRTALPCYSVFYLTYITGMHTLPLLSEGPNIFLDIYDCQKRGHLMNREVISLVGYLFIWPNCSITIKNYNFA